MTTSIRRLALAALLASLSWADFSAPAHAQEADSSAGEAGKIPILPDRIPQVDPWIEGPRLGDHDEVNVIVSYEGRSSAAAPGAQRYYFDVPEGPPMVSPLYRAAQEARAQAPEEEPAPRERERLGAPETVSYQRKLERLRSLHESARGETKRRLAEAIEALEQRRDRNAYEEALGDAVRPRS